MAQQSKKQIRHVLICPDKFKGGLTSLEVASAIKEGLEHYIADRSGEESVISSSAEISLFPMADGGDGSAELFGKLTGAQKIECRVCGPLSEEVTAYYMLGNASVMPNYTKNLGYGGYQESRHSKVAFIECATACGLALVPEELRNPLNTTTFGVGQLIRDALERGAGTIYLGVGGSSTNDCGCGMLQGLGFSVGLPEGVVANGGNLHLAGKVEEPANQDFVQKLKAARLIVINDVGNPLCGPDGAAYMYSPQKGADSEMAARLESDTQAFISKCGRTSFSKTEALEASFFPGAGTAGGMGFAFMHFLGAEAIDGFSFFSERLQSFSEKLAWADLIITGEGSLDLQSLQGKVAGGLCSRLLKIENIEDKRLWFFCGRSLLREEELFCSKEKPSVEIFQLSDIESDIRARMKREAPLLRQLAYCAAMKMDMMI